MSTLRSQYVVLFIGACVQPHLCIVTEYLPNGSLYDIMHRTNARFDWEMAIQLAIESANAINTLHCWKPTVLHRDLKPQNLLVDNNWHVKVGDFGLARFRSDKESNDPSLAKIRGTFAYAAPEVYKGQVYSTKSDIFSFAIIVWELVTRVITGSYQKPYSEHKNLKHDFQVIIQTAKNGLRPVIHSSCPPPFAQLMQRMWDPEPSLRPDFGEILQILNQIRDLFEKERGQKK